jgi:predicted transcriptional regulator
MSNDNHTTPPPEATRYPETLRITIQSGSAAFDAALDAVADDPSETDAAVVSFETAAGLRKLLTDRRLELLQSLLDEPADSITALAKRLERNYSVVHDDIDLLADTGIVKFRHAGQSKAPFVPYETIEFDVTISASTAAGDTELPV